LTVRRPCRGAGRARDRRRTRSACQLGHARSPRRPCVPSLRAFRRSPSARACITFWQGTGTWHEFAQAIVGDVARPRVVPITTPNTLRRRGDRPWRAR
jgi:hypothetical protein